MRADDMNTRTEPNKLIELRAKTDRQLAAFISNRLDSALRLACGEGDQAEAERIYYEVSGLLPWVRGLSKAEYRLLEARHAHLCQLLNHYAKAACS